MNRMLEQMPAEAYFVNSAKDLKVPNSGSHAISSPMLSM